MKSKIKEFGGYFRVLSLYYKIDYGDCRQQMKDYFKDLPDAGHRVNSNKKVNDWWDNRRKPQEGGKSHQMVRLKLFFRRLARDRQDRGRVFKRSWFDKSLEELEQDSVLRGAVRKFRQPYAIARFHKDYTSGDAKGVLLYTIKQYCHQYLYLYYIHTATGKLVRSILKFHGHHEEKIFCNCFHYTQHVIGSPKYPEWQNIERWHGNVFFNGTCLNIFFVTPDFSDENGPEYSHLMFPRLKDHKERLGLMIGLTDVREHPVALPVLIQRTNLKYDDIPPEKMGGYVREITEENGYDREEIKDIKNKLETNKDLNKLIIEQPQKNKNSFAGVTSIGR